MKHAQVRGLGQVSITFVQHQAQVELELRAPAFAASPARTPRASPAPAVFRLPGDMVALSSVGWSADAMPGHERPWISDSNTMMTATGSWWTFRVCSRQEKKMLTSHPTPASPGEEPNNDTGVWQELPEQSQALQEMIFSETLFFPRSTPAETHRTHQSNSCRVSPRHSDSLGAA